jgi:RNA-binding protein
MTETNTPMILSSKVRSALKGAAHPLRPVVLVGEQGLSDAVLKEIDLALKAHELIKVKAASQDRPAREQMVQTLGESLQCALVSHLGKTLILYRPSPKALYAVITGQAAPAAKQLRRSNEPHTPKKLASVGKKAVKKRVTRESRTEEPGKPSLRVYSAEKQAAAGRTKRPASAGKPGTRLGGGATKKSARSAMSLRAGARRGSR